MAGAAVASAAAERGQYQVPQVSALPTHQVLMGGESMPRVPSRKDRLPDAGRLCDNVCEGMRGIMCDGVCEGMRVTSLLRR